jgi:predicted regulator of Ras-like GTPase activity (Roadblock/LC7/MglB family)
MPFRECLKQIVNTVGGGIGAIVMGYDGIPIDEYLPETGPFDLQLMSVEYAHLLKEIKRTVEVLKTGEMEEVSVTTATARVLVRVINEDYFLALVIAADGNYGKGRFLLRREAPKLNDALQ